MGDEPTGGLTRPRASRLSVRAPAPGGDASRIDDLELAVRALEARLSTLEAATRAPAPAAAADPAAAAFEPPVPVLPPLEGLRAAPALAGRALVALAGAYLVRALVESGLVPTRVGIAAGLAYAAAWLLRADGEAMRGRMTAASVDAVTASLMAYPLAWEAAVRFGLSPATAAALLASITVAVMTVAVHRRLTVAAWAAALASTAVAIALAVTLRAVDVFACLLVATGLLAYAAGRRRAWTGLAWAPAVGADLLAFAAAFVALRTDGPPEGYSPLLAPLALTVVIALPACWLGAFAAASLSHARVEGPLEVVQGGASLALAAALAAPLARAVGVPTALVGAAALAGGALAAAVAWRSGREAQRQEAALFAAVAVALGLASTALLVPAAAAPLWCAMAIVAAGPAGRRSATAAAVSLCLLVAAGAMAGTLAQAVRLLAGGPILEAAGIPAALAFALTAVAVAVLMAGAPAGKMRRTASVAAGALGVLTLAGSGVRLALLALPHAAAEAAQVAAARTVVLALVALLLAFVARGSSEPTARWLMRGTLVVGAAKLLIEDLPRGRPLTLVIAFATYGAVLLLAPVVERARPEA
jgi:hypothetical protein